MASIPGLFRRGSSYYLRIVLPQNHPLRTRYKHGRLVQTLGPCSHREAVTRGTLRRAEVLAGHLWSTPPLVETPKASGEAHPAALDPILLRTVYERWIKSQPRTADTVAACGRALHLYEQQTGDPPIHTLTRAQGEAFRTWLQTLPSSSKTARDRLIWVRALLRYATEDLDWLDRNPWNRLDIRFKTTTKRRPWSEDELRLFFSQDLYTAYQLPADRKAGADAAYWIPLLAMYTGARLGELAQLRVDDIKADNGIPVLSITDDGEELSVKTEAGVRLVPIHSELTRLGFFRYLTGLKTRGESRLWPRLPQRKGRPGGYFSQWFGESRQSLGLGRHPDFHCFRHTVRSKLAASGVAEDLIDSLMGHEIRGSTGAKVYTHRTLAALSEAIENIRYAAQLRPVMPQK